MLALQESWLINVVSSSEQQKILQLFGENGHRLTNQKRTVLQVLFEHDCEPMSVEEIYEHAKHQSVCISIATVYKAVSFLEHANVLQRIRADDKYNCYELNHSDEPEGHPHCICTKCGRVFGITDESIIRMLNLCKQTIKTDHHFQVDSQNILYYGLCGACGSKP